MTDIRRRIADNVAIEDRGFVSPCWIWQRATEKGYARFDIAGRATRVHRASYEAHVGPIPEGLVIDHLCRVTACVNPTHLEPVTNAENVRRGNGPAVAAARMKAKTHCPKGHEYAPDNLMKRADGWRQCRECSRISCLGYRARRAAREMAASFPGGGAL